MRKTRGKIFQLYLNGSFHVALAVFALVQITFHFSKIPFDPTISFFSLFGTFCSYNFIKYSKLIYENRKNLSNKLSLILITSFIALVWGTFLFFQLKTNTQLLTLGLILLTFFYAIPFNKRIGNLRNRSGLKVYLVCLSWATMTLLLPIVNAGLPITTDIWLKFTQRFILVFILIGIFEIVDLQFDQASLKTLPQTLGIKRTKLLLTVLLLPFVLLEFFKQGFQIDQAYISSLLALITSFFIWHASPSRTTTFTLFWVESIPLFWWLLTLLFL